MVTVGADRVLKMRASTYHNGYFLYMNGIEIWQFDGAPDDVIDTAAVTAPLFLAPLLLSAFVTFICYF